MTKWARWGAVLGLLAGGASPQGLLADPPAPASPAPTDPAANADIVVQGQTAQALDHFLQSVAPTSPGNQISRWNEELCSIVLNVDPPIAKFIKDRIDQTAEANHIQVSKSEKCAANVGVVFANDSDALTKALFERYTRQYTDVENHFLTRDEVRQVKTPRAVRWLSANASVYGEDTLMASHIRLHAHSSIVNSIIIVDIKRINGLQWGQLADYLAMVALVNPRLGTDFKGQDTILSLFSGDPKTAPPGMTALDRSTVSSLYRSLNTYDAATQRAQMKRMQEHGAHAGGDK